jgi:hypothetical protein
MKKAGKMLSDDLLRLVAVNMLYAWTYICNIPFGINGKNRVVNILHHFAESFFAFPQGLFRPPVFFHAISFFRHPKRLLRELTITLSPSGSLKANVKPSAWFYNRVQNLKCPDINYQ